MRFVFWRHARVFAHDGEGDFQEEGLAFRFCAQVFALTDYRITSNTAIVSLHVVYVVQRSSTEDAEHAPKKHAIMHSNMPLRRPKCVLTTLLTSKMAR